MKRCQPGAKHQSDPYFDTQSYKQRRGDHRERARTWNSTPQADLPSPFFFHFQVFKTGVKRQKSHSMRGESSVSCTDGEFWSDRPSSFRPLCSILFGRRLIIQSSLFKKKIIQSPLGLGASLQHTESCRCAVQRLKKSNADDSTACTVQP